MIKCQFCPQGCSHGSYQSRWLNACAGCKTRIGRNTLVAVTNDLADLETSYARSQALIKVVERHKYRGKGLRSA